MKTIYAERHWIKEEKITDGSIHTSIDEESLGITSLSLPENLEGEPLMIHGAFINLVRASGSFSISFKIEDDKSKEDAMKSLSIMIEDLTTLRNEIIKLS